MSDAESDMSMDNGIGVNSNSVIASLPPSIANDHHSVSGSVNFGQTMHETQSLRSSVVSPDSGFNTQTGSNRSAPLPRERLDRTDMTKEWISKSEFEVFVQDLDGKTVIIVVEEDEKVESLRKKVEEKTKVPQSQQYMTYAGRKLQDGERLSSYNIKKHCKIYCHGRLRGGN